MSPKKLLGLALAALALAALGLIPAGSDDDKKSSAPKEAFRRGVTISCHGWGAAWAGPGMPAAMDEFQGLGAGWIAFHPYAFIRNNGQLRHRARTDDPTVLEPLRQAKKRGLKVLLKPHIGYWGSRFSWRGEIAFETEEDWRRFFDSYTEFITTQAAMAQAGEAAMFCIGIEYKKTLRREADWRRVIAAIRKVYKGPITYAANWDSYRDVTFWDAVDHIGIQAYFPLTEKPSPDDDTLRAGWTRVLGEVRGFAARNKKSVLFTELGYDRSSLAASKPWAVGQGQRSEELKLRCMRIALERIEQEPTVRGVFLWKGFPTNRSSQREFNLQYDAMRAVIKGAWQPKPR